MHAGGTGVPLNPVKAYAWYSLSALQGYKVAENDRNDLEKKMSSTQIAEAHKEAAKLLKKSHR